MKDMIKNRLHEEQLRKFKYSVGYKVNESPRYRPLVGVDEEFDNLPVEIYNTDDGQPMPALTTEAGEQEDAPIPGGGEMPPAPSNDEPIGAGTPPASGAPGSLPTGAPGAPPTGEPPMPASLPPQGGMGEPPMGGMGVDPGQQVDDIQNDIIKHNIAAMQSIHNQLEGLNATVQGLNSKLEVLNADVEEVREPTNSEKLMSKTNVSYPYYFNLNDFWSGNWFNEKRKAEQEKGVRELPDGTFIADFDDLPQKSKQDVQNSFNDI